MKPPSGELVPLHETVTWTDGQLHTVAPGQPNRLYSVAKRSSSAVRQPTSQQVSSPASQSPRTTAQPAGHQSPYSPGARPPDPSRTTATAERPSSASYASRTAPQSLMDLAQLDATQASVSGQTSTTSMQLEYGQCRTFPSEHHLTSGAYGHRSQPVPHGLSHSFPQTGVDLGGQSTIGPPEGPKVHDTLPVHTAIAHAATRMAAILGILPTTQAGYHSGTSTQCPEGTRLATCEDLARVQARAIHLLTAPSQRLPNRRCSRTPKR
jgi:hypothetical protein